MTVQPSKQRFEIYARPVNEPSLLSIAPQLESWDAKGSPSQVRLAAFLDHAEQTVAARIAAVDGPLAISLSVGLPEATSLTGGGRDLDNFLFPIVRRLGHQRVFAAHARKWHGASTITVEAATLEGDDDAGWSFASVRTSSSPAYAAWKAAVSQQLQAQDVVPAGDGAIELRLCLRVSRSRNWAWLWKPAIDALGCILGEDAGGRRFHPLDDRIVALGLHRTVDETLGNDIEIGVWWRSAAVFG
jgi:hypothetical protein